jgi:DNA-binding FadR family transcriptional regulator
MKQSEILAREITSEIVSQELPEGTRLAYEREMLETYQVGRSTLREALRLLESRGVITIRSGRDGGPYVRHPKASDLGEALTLLLQFEAVPLAEVFSARQALEPLMARLAAANMDDETLDAMDESIKRMAANIDHSPVFREENFRFHGLVSAAANSPVLKLFSAALESVADGLAFGVVTAAFTREDRTHALNAHRRLFRAFKSGSVGAAENAMRAHLEQARQSWLAAYQDLAFRPVQSRPVTR